jgi:tryptophan 7-halogenase
MWRRGVAMKPVQEVLIVGGGTAGWLTAAYLAQVLGSDAPGAVRITLLESSTIPTIGVGEGSFPSLRGTLSAIGIDEAQFVRDGHATFKQGIRFDHWVRPPDHRGPASYFHPFSQPSQRPGGPELLPYWLLGDAGADAPFAAAATLQSHVAAASHAPKRLSDAPYQGALNYAYHFDAGRLATVLADRAQALGVAHRVGTVEQVTLDEHGHIDAVHTRELGALRADLYIDCTGFRAALIGTALGAPWRGLSQTLFVDRALALQLPYERADAPIASFTISSAQDAGWIWDIGLQQRRGLGYVYASRYTDDDRAEQVLRQHAGPLGRDLSVRRLDMKVGYRETPWLGNCVAVGLSGGFLEPLEASGVGLVETAAYLIAHRFPFDGQFAASARGFNDFMRQRYERTVDFIKLHYALTQRRDAPFWAENADPRSMPASLQERLDMWRCRPPHRLDFVTDIEMYPPSSWQYVLYGMEHHTDLGAGAAAYRRRADARREFDTLRQLGPRALADLPPHRQLVEQLCARASQAQPRSA